MKNICFLLLAAIILPSSLFAQKKEFWGTTYEGGAYGGGVIFKTDGEGNNIEADYSFVLENPGRNAQYTHLCEAGNGKLYGMTYQGGAYNLGVLFEYDPADNTYTKMIDFNGNGAGTNGQYPYGSLVLADNGKLYGATHQGGQYSYGTLFEYNPGEDSVTVKHHFQYSTGRYVYGSLINKRNGKLYGMTFSGGTYNRGVIFEYDPVSEVYIKKADFTNSNGRYSYGSLVEASNGKLYGMTSQGGASNLGTLFEYDIDTSAIIDKIHFNGTNGRTPYGSLVQANNGKLYGMTRQGGAYNRGVLFEYNPSTGGYVKRLDFNYNEGRDPYGSLIKASNGLLYGITRYGGSANDGVIFEFNTSNNVQTVRWSFNYNLGRNPFGSLMQASNGMIYGLTNSGGLSNKGVVFEFNPTTYMYTKKIDLEISSEYGNNPFGSVTEVSNGKLYGMTHKGGNYDYGVLFEYDPIAKTYTKKVDFNNTNGREPYGSLVEYENGRLFGVTYRGGIYNRGVLFEYRALEDTFIKLIDFNYSEGRYPRATLTVLANGKIYGTTYQGGQDNNGVLFEYDPETGEYVERYDFDYTNGRYLYGGVTQSTANGKLYGMTYQGGQGNYGVIYEFEPNRNKNLFIKRFDFDYSEHGRNPYGAFTNANGKLYGLTYSGGQYNDGVLVEYDPDTREVTNKHNFTYSTGRHPYGSMITASNGKLYGVTYSGGNNNSGVVFEFDPNNGTYTKKSDFSGYDGQYPYYVQLTETEFCYDTDTTYAVAMCGESFISPSGKEYTAEGSYTVLDTVMKICGRYQFYSIDLTLNHPAIVIDERMACDSLVWDDGQTYYENNHTAEMVYPNAASNGCDSIVRLHLVLSNNGTDRIHTCGSYTWLNGRTYTADNNTDTIIRKGMGGCDSIITLNLTIGEPAVGTHTVTACGSYTWIDGNTYTSSNNTATYTLKGRSFTGCDSVVTLNLTILDKPIDVTVSETDSGFTANATGVTYRWLNCGRQYTSITGATNRSYAANYKLNASYAVEVTDQNGCKDTSDCLRLFATDVEENKVLQQVYLYPNPTQKQTIIELGSLQEVAIEVTNVNGQIVYQAKKINTAKYTLNIEGESGVYFVEISSKGEKQRYKLVKE